MSLEDLQIQHEQEFSRVEFQRNLKELIESQLVEAHESDEADIPNMIAAYEWWSQSDHGYDSKNERAGIMSTGDPLTFVYQMLLVILPMQYTATIQTVAAQLLNRVPILSDMETKIDRAKTCCELIVFLSNYTTLYDVIITDGADGVLIKSNIQLDEDVVQRMDATMYLPPMVVPPRDRFSNRDSPFYTVKRSAISDSHARHDYYLNLPALNLTASVPYTVDIETFNDIRDLEPSKEPLTPAQEHAREFNHYEKVRVTEYLASEYYERGSPFYFAWFYDSRGRMYPEGYHLTPNGDKFEKACLLFANTEIPTGSFDL